MHVSEACFALFQILIVGRELVTRDGQTLGIGCVSTPGFGQLESSIRSHYYLYNEVDFCDYPAHVFGIDQSAVKICSPPIRLRGLVPQKGRRSCLAGFGIEPYAMAVIDALDAPFHVYMPDDRLCILPVVDKDTSRPACGKMLSETELRDAKAWSVRAIKANPSSSWREWVQGVVAAIYSSQMGCEGSDFTNYLVRQ